MAMAIISRTGGGDGAAVGWCVGFLGKKSHLFYIKDYVPYDDGLQVRTDVSMNCPAGKNWVSVDGEYKAITVSGKVIIVTIIIIITISGIIYRPMPLSSQSSS